MIRACWLKRKGAEGEQGGRGSSSLPWATHSAPLHQRGCSAHKNKSLDHILSIRTLKPRTFAGRVFTELYTKSAYHNNSSTHSKQGERQQHTSQQHKHTMQASLSQRSGVSLRAAALRPRPVGECVMDMTSRALCAQQQ